LGRALDAEGVTLHNVASLPHISVAGACGTATHGSGDRNGNLATAVRALEVVTAAGEVVTLSRERNPEHFDGMVVGLGGLGLVTEVTLEVVPTFDMQQHVYEGLPVTRLAENFDAIMGAGYSVSLFTDWRTPRVNQVWVKRVTADAPFTPPREWFGATLAPRHRHPIVTLSAEPCTPQMGVRGPWYERLPHFKMNFTPSSGEELQSEYFVPRRHAVAAFRAIEGLRERVSPVLQISEVRTIASDRLWMSTAYGRDSVGFHFTWRKDWGAVRQVLPLLEEALAPFGARPHWGKLFTMSPAQVRARYEKLPDFRRLLRTYDPDGKFRNEYLDRYIFGTD
jgi:xylitol oxidase